MVTDDTELVIGHLCVAATDAADTSVSQHWNWNVTAMDDDITAWRFFHAFSCTSHSKLPMFDWSTHKRSIGPTNHQKKTERNETTEMNKNLLIFNWKPLQFAQSVIQNANDSMLFVRSVALLKKIKQNGSKNSERKRMTKNQTMENERRWKKYTKIKWEYRTVWLLLLIRIYFLKIFTLFTLRCTCTSRAIAFIVTKSACLSSIHFGA